MSDNPFVSWIVKAVDDGSSWARGLLIPIVLITLAVVACRRHESVDEVARSTILALGTLLLSMMMLQPWYFVTLLPCLVLVAAPGWLWLSGALPLIYLNGDTGSLPDWILPVIYVPFALWIVFRVATRLGLTTSPYDFEKSPVSSA